MDNNKGNKDFETMGEPLSRSQMRRNQQNREKNKRQAKWSKIIGIALVAFLVFFGMHKYLQAHKAADSIFQSTNMTKSRNVNATLKDGKPICVLLMGTDTGALGRKDTGRTDTMILCVMNPKDKKMTLVSLPRDTLVEVAGYEENAPSKINAAYDYGGPKAAVKTVQNLLDVPIDFYATINMGGIRNLIDAVGGVEIEPLMSFSYGGYTFKKGKKTKMMGKQALAYVRMRYDDPKGDYGRQERQRQVLMKLAFKASAFTSLINQNFLDSVSEQIKTDLTFDDLQVLGTKYRVATHNMESDHLQGTTEIIDGQSFEVADSSERKRVANILRKALGLKQLKTASTTKKNHKTSNEIDADDGLVEQSTGTYTPNLNNASTYNERSNSQIQTKNEKNRSEETLQKTTKQDTVETTVQSPIKNEQPAASETAGGAAQ